MIRWLVQSVVDHPDLSAGRPPAGLLTAEEREYYAGLLTPHRRRDWLLGRWTAKHLVQRQIALAHGFGPPLDSFTIAQTPNGAPAIASRHPALHATSDNGRVPLALSISHSHGYAVCALCGDHQGRVSLGVDIELVEPRADSFRQEFLTSAEAAHIAHAPATLRETLTTVVWSVKEAVLKATQLGLGVDPRALQCLPRPAQTRYWTPLTVAVGPTIYSQSPVHGPLRVWWRVLDNRLRPGQHFVLALAAYGATL